MRRHFDNIGIIHPKGDDEPCTTIFLPNTCTNFHSSRMIWSRWWEGSFS